MSATAHPHQATPAPRPHRPPRLAGASINLMYVPALVLFAVFIIYPVLQGVSIAMTNWDGYSSRRAFVGLENFARVFSDPNFSTAMTNTFIYGVGSTVIQQVLGLLFAVLLDQKLRGRQIARAIIYLPVLVSPVSWASCTTSSSATTKAHSTTSSACSAPPPCRGCLMQAWPLE